MNQLIPLFFVINFWNNFWETGFFYEERNIYLPTGISNRYSMLLKNKNWHEGIIHELSHRLWEKVSNKSIRKELYYSKKPKELLIYAERFATYCGETYFRNLQPP